MKDVTLGRTIWLDVFTHNPQTRDVQDADALPTAEVHQDDTDTAIVGAATVAQRGSKTGHYRVAVEATSNNGFEPGRSYNVAVTATVAGITGKTRAGMFVVRGKDTDLAVYQGFIWYDSVNGSPGQVVGVNGTPDNPVNSAAQALILAQATGLRAYRVAGSMALTAAHTSWRFEGWPADDDSEVDVNFQDVGGSSFHGLRLTGTQGGAAGQRATAYVCTMDGLLSAQIIAWAGIAQNAFGLGASGCIFHGTQSGFISFQALSIDLSTAAAADAFQWNGLRGEATITNLTGAAAEVRFSLDGGTLIIAASCTAGTIRVEGEGTVVDNSAGSTVDLSGFSEGAKQEIVNSHLDHLFAEDYDPASPPGNPGAWANELTEDSAGDLRYTAKALEAAPISGGQILTNPWRWSNSTAATDPGSGRIKGNNAALASITEIYINEVSDTVLNAGGAISNLRPGDRLLLNRQNTTDSLDVTVQAVPTDNGGWFTILVVVDDSSGSFANNSVIDVAFAYAPEQTLNQQEVRDAMKLSPSAGAPDTGSVDEHLDTIEGRTDVNTSTRATQAQILADANPFPGARIDATISSRSSHSDPDPGGFIDAPVSSRAVPGDAMDLVTDALDGDAVAASGAAEMAAAVFTYIVESGFTFEEVVRVYNAALAGKASGGGTTQNVFRDIADTKPRITATVDGNGNRSAIVLDVSP